MRLVTPQATYYIGFKHNELIGARVRKLPSRSELVDALASAVSTIDGLLDDDTRQVVVDLIAQNRRAGEDFVGDMHTVLERVIMAHQPVSHTTECYIKTWDLKANGERELVTSGMARCDKRDNFERSTGRLIAFLKAVKAMPEAQWPYFFKAYRRTGMRLPDEQDCLTRLVTTDLYDIALNFFDQAQLKAA